jgi:UDP-3-O-acyl N-acetylglucosamine deacetylase
VEFTGIGLHSGEPARVRLRPAPPDQGIVFVRLDLAGAPHIPARLSEVAATERGVVLGDRARVATVEHLLSAASGLGVDNLTVEVAGAELPCGDGSGLLFTDALREAGLVEQGVPRSPIVLTEPAWVEMDRSLLIALPAPRLRVTTVTTVEQAPLAPQVAEYDAGADDYTSAIAPARTWGLATDAEALRARGLARGASLANVLVIGPEGYLNPPRFPNELARHKILDLIGDLSLLGRPLHAHLMAVRAGHALHVALARAIAGGDPQPRGGPLRTGRAHAGGQG